MIIISDASPIIALHNIGQLALLKEVYREISITDIVRREVEISLPEWIKVVNEYNMALYESLTLHLDEGEASAIALAKLTPNSTLIIDERRGRKVAKELGIEIIGIMGVIVKAKKMGKIESGMDLVNELTTKGFRLSDSLLTIVRKKLSE